MFTCGDFTAMLLPQYTLLFSNSRDHSLYSLGLITWNLKGWESRAKGSWGYKYSTCLNAYGVNEKHLSQIHWPLEQLKRDCCSA